MKLGQVGFWGCGLDIGIGLQQDSKGAQSSENGQTGYTDQKYKKESMVSFTNAITDPWTVAAIEEKER
jgi:subtilase family serine protease